MKKKLILIPIILLLSICTVTLSLGYLLNQFWVRPQLWNEFQQVEKYYPQIIKDLELIKTHSIFKNSAYAKNAHLEISKFISWGSGDRISGSAVLFEKNKALTVWRQTIRSDQKDVILEKMKDNLVVQTDVSWLEKLSEYDHWNYFDQPEVLKIIQQSEMQNKLMRLSDLASLPSPDYNELWAMATVYWLQKYQQNQVPQGSLVYRKVAELIQSTGDLPAAMVAVAMLKSENNFLKSLSVQGVDPTYAESLEAFKRVSWIWQGILNTGWIQKWDSRFEPYLSAQFGLCPAVREQFMGFEAFSEMMRPQIPFEVSFSNAYQKFRPFLKDLRDICHQQQLNPFYADNAKGTNANSSEFKLSDTVVVHQFSWYHYLPFIRKAIGANYIIMVQPNYLKNYQAQTDQ